MSIHLPDCSDYQVKKPDRYGDRLPPTHLFDTHVTPTNTHISAHVKFKILKQTSRGGFQMKPLFAPLLGSQTDKSLGESLPM